MTIASELKTGLFLYIYIVPVYSSMTRLAWTHRDVNPSSILRSYTIYSDSVAAVILDTNGALIKSTLYIKYLALVIV